MRKMLLIALAVLVANMVVGCKSRSAKLAKEDRKIRKYRIAEIDEMNSKTKTGAYVDRLNTRVLAPADLDYRGQMAEIYKDRRTQLESESLRMQYNSGLADGVEANKAQEKELLRKLANPNIVPEGGEGK